MTPRASLAEPTFRCRVDVLVVDGQLCVVDRGRTQAVDADPLVLRTLLRLLATAGPGATRDELLGACDGLPDDLAVPLVDHTIDTLLEPAEPAEADAVPAVLRDPVVAQWFLARAGRRYVDYSAATVFEDDAAQMREYLSVEPEPAPEPPRPEPGVPLPHPAVAEPNDPLSALGSLLYWSFGRLRPAAFLDLLTVHLKAVPSFGSRHPFDAHLQVPPGSVLRLPPGHYGYHPSSHTLGRLGPWDGEPGIRLIIRPVLDRVWWRYRYSLAYETTLLDLGHLRGTIRQLAGELAVGLTEAPPGDGPLGAEAWQVFQLDIAA